MFPGHLLFSLETCAVRGQRIASLGHSAMPSHLNLRSPNELVIKSLLFSPIVQDCLLEKSRNGTDIFHQLSVCALQLMDVSQLVPLTLSFPPVDETILPLEHPREMFLAVARLQGAAAPLEWLWIVHAGESVE